MKRWGRFSAREREQLIGELEAKKDRADGPTKALIHAAIERLTVVVSSARARRPAATYQQSTLRHRLEIPESRAKAVQDVVRAIKAAGSIEAAAPTLGVSRRSLYRALADFDELRVAVDEVLKRRAA